MQEDKDSKEVVQNWVELTDGKYLYIPKVFTKVDANAHLDNLVEEIEWQQKSLNMYGKETQSPRLTARYGDTEKTYTDAGKNHTPNDWTETLLKIKEQVELQTETKFNSVLLNRFRDGNDSTYWYSDAEKELGENPVVVYVNMGATRKFQLNHREIKEKIELNLTHGSILITSGEFQQFWVHQTPRTKRKVKESVLLTFRAVI